jgi:hypothetical protein
MSDEQRDVPREPWKRRLAKLGIVLAGIVLGQTILYGPSLAGRKVLLPLDLLTQPGAYSPESPEVARTEVKSPYLVDLVYIFEPSRRFAASELRAGRLPMWAPYEFAGTPFTWPKFSPFLALQCCTASPVVLAWSQLLMALVAGMGICVFCRRALHLSFWPAAIAAWCYPLTGFFVLWQGYATGLAVHWLPWLLLAVDRMVRGNRGPKCEVGVAKLGGAAGEKEGPEERKRERHEGSSCSVGQGRCGPVPVGLSVVTALVLSSGHLDVGAQVLLVSGLYGLWRFLEEHRGQWLRRQAGVALVRLASGWGLGFLLAAPAVMPIVEAAQNGARMAERSAGKEERPPVGLPALPQVILPKVYGLQESGSFPLFPKGQRSYLESSAAAYAGVVATLFLAPLAWCSRRHRSANWFWASLVLFGLSWCLDVPGFVHLLRLPGLNMMSHNRLVFAASFAIVVLATTGLEGSLQGPIKWRWLFWLPPLVLAAAGVWCICRTVILPEPIATQLVQAVLQAGGLLPESPQAPWVHDLEGVQRVQTWFIREYAVAALWCGIGVTGWWVLWSRRRWPPQLVLALGAVLVADLLWFGYGRRVQSDLTLYYPRIPVLEEVARAAPGRVIGCDCLPANLAYMCGLRDIRGYDAVDPARLVELEMLAADPRTTVPDYARTQWLIPQTTVTSGGDVQLSPIFDMLSVRYLIFRGPPDPRTHPVFQGPDYWVLVNPDALPRAYVPGRVELVTDKATRLRKLASAEFDPRAVAFVESPVNLAARCRGTVEIVDEIPTRVTLSFHAETPSLVVLADLWDKGWRAYVNRQRVPILRTNHAVRGVVVPAGKGTLEFRYEPASFAWGLRFSAVAATALVAWLGFACWSRQLFGRSTDRPGWLSGIRS